MRVEGKTKLTPALAFLDEKGTRKKKEGTSDHRCLLPCFLSFLSWLDPPWCRSVSSTVLFGWNDARGVGGIACAAAAVSF
jgi:hypothetical protein